MTPDYIIALSNCMPADYSVTSAVIHENSFAVVEIMRHQTGVRHDIRLDATGICGHAKCVPKSFVRALAKAYACLLDTDPKSC